MSKQLHITIPGQPVGKGRPRFGNGRTYTPAKTKAYEKLIAEHATKEVERSRWYITDRPVKMTILALFDIPKSWNKKKTRDAIIGDIRPGKPDIDNVAKAVLDSLNGIAYVDDSQVYQLTVTKAYGDPALVVTIQEYDN